MAAVLTKVAAAVVTTAASAASANALSAEANLRKARSHAKSMGGSERKLPAVVDSTAVADIATLIADYNRMWDLLTSVKADAAYSTLQTAVKNEFTSQGF